VPSITTLAQALSQATTIATLVRILAGFFMEGTGSLVSVNGPSRQIYPLKRISGALKSEDTVMSWILGTASP
jgi:hypothetical protein